MDDAEIYSDTLSEARDVYFESLRRLGIAGRAQLTAQLCENVRSIALAGIRARHPQANEMEVVQAYLDLVFREEISPKLAKRDEA